MTMSIPFSLRAGSMPAWIVSLIAVAALLVGAAPATAQESPVKVRALAERGKAAQGGELVVAVEFQLGERYHAWPAKEIALPADIEEFAIRTQVGLAKDEKGVVLTPWAVAGKTRYPEAKKGKVASPTGEGSVEVPLYSHTAIAYIPLRLAADAPLGEQTIQVMANYQACDDSACLMPEELTFPVKVLVVKAGEAVGEVGDAGVFGKLDRAGLAFPAAGAKAPEPVAPTTGVAAPMSGAIFGIDLGSGAILLGLGAIVGGFLLNLTPCVLPVIPIKVMSLTQHAGSRRRAVVMALWMAAGVVAFWALIGVPLAFISKGFDPSRFIFGVWWVCLGIGLVIALMGLGIMGLFSINLPQSVYSVEAKADTPGGSILYGVMTAVLGLPCFGFVAGGLLAGVSVLPAATIMVIFVGLGVGMAFPYVVLAAYPKLLAFLPRTGPASDLLKQVLGILLIAAAAFFVSAGIKALLTDMPYLSGSMKWWSVGFFVAVAGVWLTVRTLQISKTSWPRVAMPLLAVAGTLGIGVFAYSGFREDRANYEELEARRAQAKGSTEVLTGVWQEYTPELYAAVRKSGKAVFLDFTADWCINCKAFKRALLDTDPVASRLKSSDIVLLEVDLTSTKAQGWELLKSLGRTGIPAWAVYGPGSESPVLVDLTVPTSQNVLASLDKAGVGKTPSPAVTDIGPAIENSKNGVWTAYTPELYEAVRASGKAVFLDFYAEWCTNGKFIRKAILNRDPVVSRLKQSDIVLLEVDMTSAKAPGWELLKQIGRSGVPTVAIAGPGGSSPVFVNNLTSENVLTSLDDAGVPKREAPALTSSGSGR